MSRTVTVRGTTIPRVGLGTWKLAGTPCFRAVRTAFDPDYRHVNRAIAEARVARLLA